ncbi:MAG: hypothetical protein ACRC9R_05795, partial [Enterovibrio sp.]
MSKERYKVMSSARPLIATVYRFSSADLRGILNGRLGFTQNYGNFGNMVRAIYNSEVRPATQGASAATASSQTQAPTPPREPKILRHLQKAVEGNRREEQLLNDKIRKAQATGKQEKANKKQEKLAEIQENTNIIKATREAIRLEMLIYDFLLDGMDGSELIRRQSNALATAALSLGMRHENEKGPAVDPVTKMPLPSTHFKITPPAPLSPFRFCDPTETVIAMCQLKNQLGQHEIFTSNSPEKQLTAIQHTNYLLHKIMLNWNVYGFDDSLSGLLKTNNANRKDPNVWDIARVAMALIR